MFLKFRGWALAAVVGIATGGAIWGLAATLGLWEQPPDDAPATQAAPPSSVGASAIDVLPQSPEAATALRYAQAYQAADNTSIIELTAWMQERLQYVAARQDGQASLAQVEAELTAAALERTAEGNQLRDEGIDDQYIFTPGARLEIVAADEGEPDLSERVAQRVWMRCTYESRVAAPRDDAGIPIRSVVVGLNVSEAGQVLKANVVGNLDIDYDSISYDWRDAP